MADTLFDIHGVRIAIRGDAEAVAALGVHFGVYIEPDSDAATVTITLLRARPSIDSPGRLRADQILERGIVYNDGCVTWVDYHGHGTSRYDFDAEEGTIRAPLVEDLVELGYLMLHSRLGVLLEERGLVRLHALGFVVDGRGVLVLAPSGGGKSTLARSVLRRNDVSLLGDDLVLVDLSGRVLPFHSPIGIPNEEAGTGLGRVHSFHRRHHPPKWIVDPLSLGERLHRAPVAVALVAELRRVSRGPSQLRSMARRQTGRVLFRDMVVGLGLPQVLELVARRGAQDLAQLIPSALRRARHAAALERRARGATLEVFTPDEAVSLLVDDIRSR